MGLRSYREFHDKMSQNLTSENFVAEDQPLSKPRNCRHGIGLSFGMFLFQQAPERLEGGCSRSSELA
jgi:hypothetical protein